MVGGVDWSHGPNDSRTMRLLLHVALGVPLGLALTIGGLAVAPALGDPLAVGVLGGAAILVAAGAVGARRTGGVPDVVPGTGRSGAPAGVEGLVAAVGPVGLAVATVGAAGVLAVVATVGIEWTLGVALAGHLLPAATLGLLRTEGELRPDERELRYGDDEIPLRALSSVRSLRLGGYVFLWCTFVRGTGRTPGIVVLPAWVYRESRDAFESGVAASDELLEDPDRPLRLVAYGFGGGMLLLGLLSSGVLYAGGVSILLGAYVGGSLALLGLFFLVLGRYET